MTRIRDRFGEATFTAIFKLLIARWRKDGHIRGRRIVADASLVEADAAVDSLVERDDADADSRMITDAYVTTGSRHECPALPERIEHQCEHLRLPIHEVIADRGYGRGPTYAQLRAKKIRHYIPMHDANAGRGKLTPSHFKYDRRKDRYRCHEGRYLYPYETTERGSVRRYRITGGHCRNCLTKDSCLPDCQKFRARFVYRGVYQDEVEAVRRRQHITAFRNRLTERKWKIEGLFGEAKQNHSLRRTRYRRLSKVQIQFFMIAIALNCKRLINNSDCFRLVVLVLRRNLTCYQYFAGKPSHQPAPI